MGSSLNRRDPRVFDVLLGLNVHIEIEHMGLPRVTPENSNHLDDIPDFDCMLKLFKNKDKQFWVTISGPGYDWTRPMLLELIKEVPRRLVYGSHYPQMDKDGDRMREIDIRHWTENLLRIVSGDEKMKNDVFRDNAHSLWGLKYADQLAFAPAGPGAPLPAGELDLRTLWNWWNKGRLCLMTVLLLLLLTPVIFGGPIR